MLFEHQSFYMIDNNSNSKTSYLVCWTLVSGLIKRQVGGGGSIQSVRQVQDKLTSKRKSKLSRFKDLTQGRKRLISPTWLCTCFKRPDPKSEKRQSSHQCLFALLGSALVKAVRKMLMKSTPVVNLTNIL